MARDERVPTCVFARTPSYMGYSFGATWMNSSTSVLAPFTNVSCAGTV